MVPALTWSEDDILKTRDALIREELAIRALHDEVDSADDWEALWDEIARRTALLDQDWETWKFVRDSYEEEKRGPRPPSPDRTPEEQLAALDALNDRCLEMMEDLDADIAAETSERSRRYLMARQMEMRESWEKVRNLRDRVTSTLTRPASTTQCVSLVRHRPRTAPRPRAFRSRAVSRAASRGGDSGDDSSGESDLPAALARLGRALWRALIMRWLARVIDHGGD